MQLFTTAAKRRRNFSLVWWYSEFFQHHAHGPLTSHHVAALLGYFYDICLFRLGASWTPSCPKKSELYTLWQGDTLLVLAQRQSSPFPSLFVQFFFFFFKNPIRCIHVYPYNLPSSKKRGGPKSNRFIWEREFTWLSRRELTIRPRLNSKSFFLQYIIRELGEINSSCSGLPHTR